MPRKHPHGLTRANFRQWLSDHPDPILSTGPNTCPLAGFLRDERPDLNSQPATFSVGCIDYIVVFHSAKDRLSAAIHKLPDWAKRFVALWDTSTRRIPDRSDGREAFKILNRCTRGRVRKENA